MSTFVDLRIGGRILYGVVAGKSSRSHGLLAEERSRDVHWNEAIESAEGTAPSAAHRTRREPLDSPGSCCSNHKLAASAPMSNQRWGATLRSIQPCKSASLVPSQALVFPHCPTDDQAAHIVGQGLELRTPEAAVVSYPATQAGCRPVSQCLKIVVAVPEHPAVTQSLAHCFQGRPAHGRGKALLQCAVA